MAQFAKIQYPNPMDAHAWFKSISGTLGTILLGKVTVSTGSSLTALAAILTSTVTTIYTVMKIIQWLEWWKHRREPSQKPPSI